MTYRGEMGESARRNTRMEPGFRKRRSLWTASSPKTGPKCVWKGLVEFSTMSLGSTPAYDNQENTDRPIERSCLVLCQSPQDTGRGLLLLLLYMQPVSWRKSHQYPGEQTVSETQCVLSHVWLARIVRHIPPGYRLHVQVRVNNFSASDMLDYREHTL